MNETKTFVWWKLSKTNHIVIVVTSHVSLWRHLNKKMTLEAERQYEKRLRLKFGHLESELTRWKVGEEIIYSYNELDYNELGYNELGYIELGYDMLSVLTILVIRETFFYY